MGAPVLEVPFKYISFICEVEPKLPLYTNVYKHDLIRYILQNATYK
jgi:hypothetical protein